MSIGHISNFHRPWGPRVHRDEDHQSTTTSTTTAPGAAAAPEVQGLLSNLQNLEGNTGLTSGESDAIAKLTAIGAAGNPYGANTSGAVNSLLTGGNATSEIPAVRDNLAAYKASMQPYLASDYSTLNSPDVQAALQAIRDDTTGSVNGTFAASGRSGSGMNVQTLARGIAQGEAPVILNQANQDTATRIAAANGVLGAGNTAATTIAGMNQNAATNQNAGINDVAPALSASTWGPQTEIAAQELGQQIPASNLGMLAQIGIPLAQLYSTTTGTSDTTKDPSLLSDLSTASNIVGKTANGGSGLLGLLGLL